MLRASWFPSPPIENCALILHGIGDSRASSTGFAQMFTGRGYSALAPDSRAHGESGGDEVTYGLLERQDVLDWAHWLRGQGCQKVYGLGESLGASILIQASAMEPAFAAIVSEGAYADLQDAAEYRLARMLPMRASFARPLAWMAATNGKFYARLFYGLNFNDASPLEAIRHTRTPILLIHGLDDDQTPPEHSRRLAASDPTAELWLVPGLKHFSAYSAGKGEYERRIFAWYQAH
jgi:fermentation-respiration switch protein FrsA (DUF1100 family)